MEKPEVRVIYLLDPPDQLTTGVVQTMVLLDRHLNTALLSERCSVGQHLGGVDVLALFFESEVEREFLTERVCVCDLLPGGRDGIASGTSVRTDRLHTVDTIPGPRAFPSGPSPSLA
jgi:hypothetical protein